MRGAIIDLRIRNEIQMLGSLSAEDLEEHVGRVFALAAGLEVDEEPEGTVFDADEPVNSGRPDAVTHEDREGSPSVGAVAGTKTGEPEIQNAILRLMLDGAVWSNADLKARLADILPLSEADRGVGARPAEELWENRVNNALARARASSLYAKGMVENRGLGLHIITEAGSDHVSGLGNADL